MSAGARPPAERIPAKQRHAPLRLRAVERTQRAMKDQWYGDKRDLVKWGVLLRLAHLYGASRILQVAYYGESAWGWLEIDGQPKPMDEVVIDHFRNIRNIRKLTAQLRIDVITSPFSDRQRYTQEILREIASSGDKSIVFLDPDTGLEPQGKAGLKHVRESELLQIWAGMRAGDVLVLYQHQTNRNARPWTDSKRAQFERALGLPPATAKVARAAKVPSNSGMLQLARDVVFFYCQKPPCGKPTGLAEATQPDR